MKTVVNTVGKNEDGVVGDLQLAVLSPSAKQRVDADLYRRKVFHDALKAGVMVEAQLGKYLKAMDLWDDTRQAESDRLRRSLDEGELAIRKGGIKESEMRVRAIQMSRDRAALQDLRSIFTDLKRNTAEAVADEAHFNFLVSCTTVYNTGRFEGRPYFTRDGISPSVDAYVERSTEQVAYDAATKLSEILYGTASSLLASLPENDFLLKHKFVDAEFNFVDKDGKKVDEKGRRIDEEGFLIDSEGRRVDSEGVPIDAEGRYAVEFTPFLDDEGNPIES
jgi:hypothetical protein